MAKSQCPSGRIVEGLGRERLREEVDQVVTRRDVRDEEALLLHELTHGCRSGGARCASPLLVVLGIVREVASPAVVGRELDRGDLAE